MEALKETTVFNRPGIRISLLRQNPLPIVFISRPANRTIVKYLAASTPSSKQSQ
jgi:hypothetical protein